MNPIRLPTTKELKEDARRIAAKRRKELPQMVIDQRKVIWAQVQMLKEMEQHPYFCGRIMELFCMEEELAEDLGCSGSQLTFEEFWDNEVPESREPNDVVNQARLRALARLAFEAGKKS